MGKNCVKLMSLIYSYYFKDVLIIQKCAILLTYENLKISVKRF